MNVAAVAFDVLRGISFALTISFPLCGSFIYLFSFANHSITDSAGVFINWLNDVVAQRAFSRKLEMEADAVGMDVSFFLIKVDPS